MGNKCNLDCNCKKNETSKQEVLNTIYEIEENNNNEYTLLNGIYIKSGKIICNFINHNYRRIYSKMRFNKMLSKIEKLFTPETNYILKTKDYYIGILNQKIEDFFVNKRNILENFFNEEDFFLNLHDFDSLIDMIKQYYANDIYNNKINFYNEFADYVRNKKNLKIIIDSSKNEDQNKVNLKFKKSIRKIMKIHKLISINNKKGSLLDSQINFIQNDIQNMFKLCLSTPCEQMPKKLDDIDNSNKSFLLMLLADEFKLNTKIFISGKLRIFIKLFYYIFIMKKYNYIASTNNEYYKIMKEDYDEIINNQKYYVNISDVEKFKSINKKKKILFHIFSSNKKHHRNNNILAKSSNDFSIEKGASNNSKSDLNISFKNSLENSTRNNDNKNGINLNNYYNKNFNITNTYKKTSTITTGFNSYRNVKKLIEEESNVSSKYIKTSNDDDDITNNLDSENQKRNINNKSIFNNKTIDNQKNDNNDSINKNMDNNKTKDNNNSLYKNSDKTISSLNFSEKKKKVKFVRGNTKFIPNLNQGIYHERRKTYFHSQSRGKTTKYNSGSNNLELFRKLVQEDYSKLEIYNGEYDKNLLLYAGYGTLIKPRNSSLYNGTFRYGKKEGIGIFYREYSKYHFKYYMGEFTKNQFDGFGLLIEFNDKKVTILKGYFYNSNFISGILFIFNENIQNGILEITKYEGDLEENNSNLIIFKNFGHLIKLSYSISKNKKIYELEDKYDYTGHFNKGKEEGKGVLRHKLKKENYSYEYKGNFINGEINGFGIIEYSDNFFIKKYEGFFCKNKCFHKYGIVYFKSGDVYEGFFDKKNLKSICGLYWHNNNNDNYDYHLGIDNYFGGFFEDKKSGFGRYVSYNDNLTKLFVGNYLRGEKNGLFTLIYNEEEECSKKKKKKNVKLNDITQTISHIFSGIPIDNKYEFLKQRKNYFFFEKGDLTEKSDRVNNLISNK